MYDFICVPSPLGTLTIAAAGDAITALVIEGQNYADRHLAGEGKARRTPVLLAAKDWLDAYFSGGNPDPDALRIDPAGTEFQKRVWLELQRIPYGTTVSYGALAERLGSSARAVGGAVGRNPVSILIPCHRVVGADGSLTGYAGGVENKRRLLRLEGVPV